MKRLEHKTTRAWPAAAAIYGSLLALAAHGADSPTAPTPSAPPPASPNAAAPGAQSALFQKPAWLTDLSLGVKESYDNNLLGVSGNATMQPQSSWITSVSPKVGFNFAPLLGDQSLFQLLGLGYAPDFVFYHSDPSAQPSGSRESYDAQRLATQIKGKADAFSFNLDNSFNYIDGASVAPIYTSGTDTWRSGFASIMAMARREQIQDRAKVAFQYDLDKWFIRPTASLLYYDMMTDLRSTAGYQNYPDRYDANGGADLGYKLTDDFAFTLGYRYGHQYQQTLPVAADAFQLASVNNYQRVLAGFEGKPWNWLAVSLQAGPDFRSYASSAPVSDPTPVKYYGEGSLTAEISSNDTITAKYKQWQWVSYTGKVPFYDSLGELAYHRKLTQALSLDLGGRIECYDMNAGWGAELKNANVKKDFLYTPSIGLNYAFNYNLSANIGYSADFARNGQANLSSINQMADYRDFDRQVVSLGVAFKF